MALISILTMERLWKNEQVNVKKVKEWFLASLIILIVFLFLLLKYVLKSLCKKWECSTSDVLRLARLSCSCYPATIPGRSFSLLCYQSRAYGSVQSPRSLKLALRGLWLPEIWHGQPVNGKSH